MSIIYDALKKVEESNVKEASPEAEANVHHKRKLRTYLLYGLAACIGLFAVNLLFSFLTHPKQIVKSEMPTPAPVPIAQTPIAPQIQAPIQAQPSPKSSPVKMSSKGLLILNGIFFSENEGYALVNNHIVKEGDTVNSATVKSIGVDVVELEVDGETVMLTTAQR